MRSAASFTPRSRSPAALTDIKIPSGFDEAIKSELFSTIAASNRRALSSRTRSVTSTVMPSSLTAIPPVSSFAPVALRSRTALAMVGKPESTLIEDAVTENEWRKKLLMLSWGLL